MGAAEERDGSLVMKECWKDFLSENPPDNVRVRDSLYTIESAISSGSKSIVFSGKNEWGRPVILKFAIIEDYQKDRSIDAEMQYAAKLSESELFVELLNAGQVAVTNGEGEDADFAVFVEQIIRGTSLRSLLDDGEVNTKDVKSWILAACEALLFLSDKGLAHDDFHAENIRMREPATEIGEPQLRIIDLGSVKEIERVTKQVDDHRWLARHIVELTNRARQRPEKLSGRDHEFLDRLRDLVVRMVDTDGASAMRDPRQIAEYVLKRWDDSFGVGEEPTWKDPFSYRSAEFLPSEADVVATFSNLAPWVPQVAGPTPLVLTGPRGAGKSSAFLRYSLSGLVHEPNPREALRQCEIAGVYVNCGTELRTRLGWINDEGQADKMKQHLWGIFNVVITREVLRALRDLTEERGAGMIKERELNELGRWVQGRFGIVDVTASPENGAAIVALDQLEVRLMEFKQALHREEELDAAPGLEYLAALARYLKENIRFFSGRPLGIFLDDFSERQIPAPVQGVLNKIVLSRIPGCIFKISTDRFGWSGMDEYCKTYDLQREFVVLDCGQSFLGMKPTEKRELLTAIVDKRLEKSGYVSRCRDLLGKDDYYGGTLVDAILKDADKKDSVPLYYHGTGTVTRLCAGDVAWVLGTISEVFRQGGINKDSDEMVSPEIQDKAIKSISTNLVQQAGRQAPHGDKLADIIDAFGTLSHEIVVDGRRSGRKNKNGEDRPLSVPRIEIDGDPFMEKPRLGSGEVDETLEEQAREMLRRDIFVDEGIGKTMMRGQTTTHRFRFRPMAAPVFKAPLVKTDAVKMSRHEFWKFIKNPKKECRRILKEFKGEVDMNSSSLTRFMEDEK